MVKNEENKRPSAKRLKKLDIDNVDLSDFTETVSYIKISQGNFRKLEAISALKNISFGEIVYPLLDEKIMNIDVVKYVEELSNDDSDIEKSFRYSGNSMDIKISSEAHRRLIIFAGVNNCSIDDFVVKFVDEIINGIDLVTLVKDEFR